MFVSVNFIEQYYETLCGEELFFHSMPKEIEI